MNRREFITVVKATARDFIQDDAPYTAGALTYFSFLSLFPLVVLGIILVGIFVEPADASTFVFDTVARYAPGSRELLANAMDEAFSNRETRGWYAAASLVILVISASSAFGALDTAINRAWGSEKIPNFFVSQLINFAMMVGVSLLLIASLGVSAVLTTIRAFASFYAPETPLDQILWLWLTIAVSVGTVFVGFLLLYRFVPRCPVSLRDVWLGALLAAIVWTLVKELFALYLGSTFARFEATYGTLGAAFALVTWIHLSSLIILAGAEFTSETARVRRLRQQTGQALARRPKSPWLSA